ncbi:LysR family transcriptional regulator [Aerosakkonemataceae cyanobacterium BLCC-F50]|uniref:LysR family transcriptional regulator n=1 Tax=Floridaenema flaviceps BLCC-F50 TaxID=3153642 RepID=A0ABV4XZ95_9CYAN
MNLTGIDLNLLVVFDALMMERHVTRAGERIGLSQPATSNALARLRNLTHDELFVRSRGGLQPTPVAIALAQQIQPALRQIQTALSLGQNFDPKSSDRVFTIGMTDYMEFVLLPRLLETLEKTAPQIKIQIRSGDRQHLLALLDSGQADLICGLFPEQVAWHEEEFLFEEKFVCLCRRDHPLIGDSLSLEDYLAVSHLLVSIKEDMVGRVDELLAEQGWKRRITISIPHFLVAPFILARTNLVATLAQRVAKEFADAQNLKSFPCPLPLKGFSVYMRSHRSTLKVATHIWLRATIKEIALAV